MNNGFELELWGDFFLATGVIGAALAGLVLVAFATDLRAILGVPGRSVRAAEAILLLISPAVVAIAGLWPADDPKRVGILIAVVGSALWLVLTGLQIGGLRGRGSRGRLLAVLLGQAAIVAAIVAGVSLAIGVGLALDYQVGGALVALATGLGGAWVLLVDSHRPAIVATTSTERESSG